MVHFGYTNNSIVHHRRRPISTESAITPNETPAPWRPPSRFKFYRGVLLYIFRVITGAYALSSLGALFLHLFVGEQWLVVAFTNSIIHMTFIPALILLPLCLLLRQWFLSIMLAPIAAFWLIWYAPYLMPKSVTPPADDAPVLTVLTYNLLATNTETEAIIDVLQAVDTDVIALQELDSPVEVAISDALRNEYPYSVTYPGWVPGIGFYSRYEIIEDELWHSTLQNQRLVIDFEGTPVVIYNVHPSTPITAHGFEHRANDMVELFARVDAEDDEAIVIVLGDFNLMDRGDDYGRMRDRFDDAFFEAGQGLGFTFFMRDRIPIGRIDYVFYEAPFRAVGTRVWPEHAGSDHAPLVVELALED